MHNQIRCKIIMINNLSICYNYAQPLIWRLLLFENVFIK